jgi:cytochrome b
MTEPKSARRWDPLVKLTHWGIVMAIIANALFLEPGSGWHVQVGYAMAALLVLRWLWGVIGPRPARITSFLPSIPRTLAHLRAIAAGRQEEHVSHNPLGAWMVFAIWATLATVAATGIAMSAEAPLALPATIASTATGERVDAEGEEAAEQHGDEEESEGGEGSEEWLEEVHEGAVNLLYLLIALHLAGVLFESMRSRGRVVQAMLPGG